MYIITAIFRKWTWFFECLFPTHFLNDSEIFMNHSGNGLGIFTKNLSITIGGNFFLLFFLGFPAFVSEGHGKYSLLVINNSCDDRRDLWNLRPFYRK